MVYDIRAGAPIPSLTTKAMAPSNPTSSCLSFAAEVLERLRCHAHEVSKTPGAKAFGSNLAAELSSVQQCLEELGQNPVQPCTERRVLKLLDNLDRLCQLRLLRVSAAPRSAPATGN